MIRKSEEKSRENYQQNRGKSELSHRQNCHCIPPLERHTYFHLLVTTYRTDQDYPS